MSAEDESLWGARKIALTYDDLKWRHIDQALGDLRPDQPRDLRREVERHLRSTHIKSIRMDRNFLSVETHGATIVDGSTTNVYIFRSPAGARYFLNAFDAICRSSSVPTPVIK